MTACNERMRLLELLSDASMTYARRATELATAVATANHDQYKLKRKVVRETRGAAIIAKAALRAHEREHGCKPSA